MGGRGQFFGLHLFIHKAQCVLMSYKSFDFVFFVSKILPLLVPQSLFLFLITVLVVIVCELF